MLHCSMTDNFVYISIFDVYIKSTEEGPPLYSTRPVFREERVRDH